jgi:hypothetical protein
MHNFAELYKKTCNKAAAYSQMMICWVVANQDI